MDQAQYNTLVNFIWNIADDVLRDVYVRGKYRDVILPMTVLRRLDVLLEPTKDAVLGLKKHLDVQGVIHQDEALSHAAGQAFCNASPFTLRRLLDNPKQLRQNFTAYLDGFSGNVREIIAKFDFRSQLVKLDEAHALAVLIEKFIDSAINLGPEPVRDANGNICLPGLDNHGMGYVFEELIRRFNEENNEEAGEHFTPREVVRLMATLIFQPIADDMQSGTYLLYDGACGTGGMLSVAEEVLKELAAEHGKEIQIRLHGQEINAETYAICKADLLLKGEGEEAENIRFGSTLSNDAYPSLEFDFMLSNPPYGKSWKTDMERMGGKSYLNDPRFIIDYAGDPEYSMITRSSDGQLMFLVNMLSKMKHRTPLGSRIAEVHNGSSLFTGDAGQGESNIRRWIIENDWLEAIIALPLNMFYNTGIATYVWVLTNRKPEHRRGKVQLIDATTRYRPLRKNLGKKNCELAEEHLAQIYDTFEAFEEADQSRILPNAAFGYWKTVVDRPLRLRVDLSSAALGRLRAAVSGTDDEPIANVADRVATRFGAGPHLDYNAFLTAIRDDCEHHGVKLLAKREKLLTTYLASRDPGAAPVIRKQTRLRGGETLPDDSALWGRYPSEIDGCAIAVEYEADPDLRDTEQVPFLEEGGIEAFIRREVLPHVSDAWVDGSKTQIGYEISFTRYFYKPQRLRTLEEIRADICTLEAETEGLLAQIVGGK